MSPDRRSLSRFLDRHRRSLAAALAGLAVLVFGLALRPPRAELVGVPVAASALPAGHRLTSDDVQTAQVPVALAPASTSGRDPADLVGSVLAARVEAGEAISLSRLLDPSLRSWQTPAGQVPLPVRFADAGAVDLLGAGQRIDVLASQSASELTSAMVRAAVIATDVLVLAVVRGPTEDSGGAGAADRASDLVMLAVTPDQAVAVAGAEATARVTFTFTEPST